METSKFLGILLIILALIIVFSIGGYFLFLKSAGVTTKIQPKLIKQTTINKLATDTHPDLYYVDLEYNPKTNLISQLSTGTTKGDLPPLFPSQPPNDPNEFIYRLEVVSNKNELLQKGWSTTAKKILQTAKGDLDFRVTTVYAQGAIIRLFYPDGSIAWTGQI
ncbi:hypothetical protein HYW41_00265 [Candidatus Daviesbacteria bacterium]|nr:hypothetical protein [Candidatus Daviesbacteria bacterium]